MNRTATNERAPVLTVEEAVDANAKQTAAAYYMETRPDIQAVIDARGKRILDVGCAAGELGRAFKQAGAVEVVGIERSDEAASLAKKWLDQVFVIGVEDFSFPVD